MDTEWSRYRVYKSPWAEDLPLILAKDAYFDVLNFRMSRPLRSHVLMELQELVKCHTGLAKKRYPGIGPFYLRVFLPSPQALELLARILPASARLTYVEVALDWEVANQQDANRLARWIIQRHTKPYQRALKDKLTSGVRIVKRQTYYSNRAWSPQVNVLYASKPCRITEKPCCHFEVRIYTANALKRRGISSVTDLLQMDFRKFFQKHLKLHEVNSVLLGKQACGKPNCKSARMKRLSCYSLAGRIILSSYTVTHEGKTIPCLQTFLDECKASWLKKRSCLILISNVALLPGPALAL